MVAEGVGEEGEEWGNEGNDSTDDAENMYERRAVLCLLFLGEEDEEAWHRPSLLFQEMTWCIRILRGEEEGGGWGERMKPRYG